TFAGLAGAKVPGDRVIDGHDILPLISGQQGAVSPHDMYYYYRGRSLESARKGKWKLRRTGKKKGGVELYDLNSDISETKNKAADNEALVKGMLEQMDAFHAALVKSQRPAGKL
ncbi:MAG: arylsulfatase, partial [Kiritimatiellae bacterium]|nr:arylsulfatase [Kiritimatiellia bacterium]